MQSKFKINNFDLIRLVAALEVVIHHSMVHLSIEYKESLIYAVLSHFPGVPIFFFVSGFLISKSYENNSHIGEYAMNRLLRIFPGLFLCVLLSLCFVFLTDYLKGVEYRFYEMVVWIIGQISVFQFYNPDFMRGFGVGVLNGSLWTISVEIQFYLLVPVFYYVLKSNASNKGNKILCGFVVFFMIFHVIKFLFLGSQSENLMVKLFGVSFAPWIWMFLIGVLFQKNFDILYKMLSGRAAYILPVYLLLSYFLTTFYDFSHGNSINPLLYIVLSILIFSIAYTYPGVSEKILKRNDISYGLYIYHMPVVNVFIYYGMVGDSLYLAAAITLAFFLAFFSWFVVEKPAIKFKKHPLNPLGSVGNN